MVAGDLPQPMFAQAVDQPSDAGPVDRARTHRTGLGGRIERGAAQDIGVDRRAGLRGQQPFGVRGAVIEGHVTVLGFEQHLPVQGDQDGAERMIAVSRRTAGHLKGEAQEMRVELRLAEC